MGGADEVLVANRIPFDSIHRESWVSWGKLKFKTLHEFGLTDAIGQINIAANENPIATLDWKTYISLIWVSLNSRFYTTD